EQTSYTVVIVPPGLDRIFLHNPGANNTFCAADINYELVSRAKIFHFGYPPLMKRIFENEGEELIKIFKRVKKLGVTTSLDMSLPDASSESGNVDWEKVLEKLLPFVDIFIPSVEETMFMISRGDFDYLNENANGQDILENLDINALQGLGEKLMSYGTRIAVIKCGIKGYYIQTQSKDVLQGMGRAKPADLDNWSGRELHEESFHVPDVVSATGSGDTSIAGFLASILNGKTIEESIRTACAVGGQNVQAVDAISGIKTWDETLGMIPGWKKNSLSVNGSYWKYDGIKHVWVGQKDKTRK
ncbi:MAG: PfkB family carbohydrate kinase, partial [Firmicutes bacterium]|nr:PfkB family carbohydrate kinase [Bacillota bacterium]